MCLFVRTLYACKCTKLNIWLMRHYRCLYVVPQILFVAILIDGQTTLITSCSRRKINGFWCWSENNFTRIHIVVSYVCTLLFRMKQFPWIATRPIKIYARGKLLNMFVDGDSYKLPPTRANITYHIGWHGINRNDYLWLAAAIISVLHDLRRLIFFSASFASCEFSEEFSQ